MPSTDVGVLVAMDVHFDDLDPMGTLHNSRYQVWVERARVGFGRERGLGGESGFEGDGFQVVKAFTITYDVPVMAHGQYAVHLWMERVSRTIERP